MFEFRCTLRQNRQARKKEVKMEIKDVIDLLEALTILCFGLSWPISIRKSYISRTTKGKSLFFEIFLLVGYTFGIVRKIIQITQGSSGFVFYLSFVFYIVNFVAISIDVALYFRNLHLDRQREQLKEKSE